MIRRLLGLTALLMAAAPASAQLTPINAPPIGMPPPHVIAPSMLPNPVVPAPSMEHAAEHPMEHPKDAAGEHAEHHEAEPEHEEHEHAEHEHEAEAEQSPGFFVHAEYLLLQPRRRAADFAIVSSDASRPVGNLESLNWDADSGFRVGGGYHLGEGWQLEAVYTYFHSCKHRDLASPTNGALFPTLNAANNFQGFNAITSAVGDSNLNFNVVDVTVGHTSSLAHGFDYTLSAGGRYARITQQLSALYNGGDLVNDFDTRPNRFEGGGLVASAEARWKAWRGFGLYARATGSLLAGNLRAGLVEGNFSNGTLTANTSDHFRKVVPVAEMAFGLLWQTEGFKGRIGYEAANWFGLIDSPDFVGELTNKTSRRTSDLSLDGLAFSVELDF